MQKGDYAMQHATPDAASILGEPFGTVCQVRASRRFAQNYEQLGNNVNNCTSNQQLYLCQIKENDNGDSQRFFSLNAFTTGNPFWGQIYLNLV